MAAALGNLSPLITASAAGGSVQSHGIFLLGSVPATNAAALPKGTWFTPTWPQALIGAYGIKNPGTASPLGPSGFLNNSATVNAIFQPGGFGFNATWPQNFLGTVGLKQVGTVWATGPLGLFFDGKPLNQATLPGSDPGLAPLSGAITLAPSGVRIAGNATAFGPYGSLLNGGTLNQALLRGDDPGLMPLSGARFQGSHGPVKVPSSAVLGNAGLSYLYGVVIVGVLPTYNAIDTGRAALRKIFSQVDKAGAANRLVYTTKDSAGSTLRIAFKVVDSGAVKQSKTFSGKDNATVANYAAIRTQDSGACFWGLTRYRDADSSAAILYNSFTHADTGRALNKATFAQTDISSVSNRAIFKSANSGINTLNAAFSPIWPQPFISRAGLKLTGTAAPIGPLGPLNNTAILNAANLKGGFGFNVTWPQNFLGKVGLKASATASATGSLGVLFNGQHLNLAGFWYSQDGGFSVFKNTFRDQDAGSASFRFTFAANDSGSNSQPALYHCTDRGRTAGLFVRHSQDVGACLQAQAGLAGYLLYRGIDTAPDFTAAPWQTFTAPPFTTPALATGHSYQFALKRRNEFGIVSAPGTIWTATPGNPAIKPAAPTAITIKPAAGGTVSISALYDWRADGGSAADKFLIYLRSDGSNPNPATDTPTVIPAWHGAASATLNWQSPATIEGATVKALVRTRRSGSGGADSTNTGIVSAIATFIGPTGLKGIIIEEPGIGESEGF
jgi:hypothetical protein